MSWFVRHRPKGDTSVEAVAAEVRQAVSGDAMPRPPHRPHRHHFAAPSLAAALVPSTPTRTERAARERVGSAA